MIETTTISQNPYAPSGAQDVKLYSFNGCDGLTLGQLVNAVCCKIGVALEDQAINKTNVMTRHSRRLEGMSEILSGIMTGSNYSTKLTVSGYTDMTYGDFLTKICGLSISDGTESSSGTLPKDPTTEAGKIQLYTALKGTIESSTVTNQQDMVDLQTTISRRDVAYTTTTNVVRALGTAEQQTASNF